jgi:hypothetical protein
MDPQFPKRLLTAGYARILEFIQYLSRVFSERQLTHATDRSVAFSGIETRIAKAINTRSIYGIPEKFMHQTLLWQRSQHGKLNKIEYEKNPVPSWSWMACSGPIEFAISLGTEIEGRIDLCFEESQENALLAAEVAKFINCELKGEETTEVQEKGTEKIVGRMRYDKTNDIPDFNVQRCIVLGRDSRAKEKYYVLVVSLTLNHEYTRIGIGEIDRCYLLRIEGKVRVI